MSHYDLFKLRNTSRYWRQRYEEVAKEFMDDRYILRIAIRDCDEDLIGEIVRRRGVEYFQRRISLIIGETVSPKQCVGDIVKRLLGYEGIRAAARDIIERDIIAQLDVLKSEGRFPILDDMLEDTLRRDPRKIARAFKSNPIRLYLFIMERRIPIPRQFQRIMMREADNPSLKTYILTYPYIE